MTEHERTLVFTTLEFIRKEVSKTFPANSDWKDIDDYVFSNLDFTVGDLECIYKDRGVLIYTGSAIEGFAPRKPTYDELYPFFYHRSKFDYGTLGEKIMNTPAIGVVVTTDMAKPIVLTEQDAPFLAEMYKSETRYQIQLEYSRSYSYSPAGPIPVNTLTFVAIEPESKKVTPLYTTQKLG